MTGKTLPVSKIIIYNHLLNRMSHISELVYPLNTVLDDSIGCAVWFAARGQGKILRQTGDYQPYKTTARVRQNS